MALELRQQLKLTQQLIMTPQLQMAIKLLQRPGTTASPSLASDEEKPHHKKHMKHYRWKDMEGYYKVFERPGLLPFLTFLFKHFNVSVWTAASKS